MDLIPFALPPASAGSITTDVVRWLIELPASIFHAYTSVLESAADSIRDLFESYGYWVIFLGTLFENTLLLGLVIPGLIVVLLAGINAEDGLMDPFYAAALGILGTIMGDTISYLMGRLGWARFGQGQSMRTFSDKVRGPLMRRGALFVMVYHFAGYTRVVGPAAAGLLRMPYRKWAPADHFGAALWVSSFLAVGYGLGAAGITLDSTDKYFRYVEWGLLALIGFWGLYVFRSSHRAIMARMNEALGEDGGADGAEEKEGRDEPEREVVGVAE